MGETFLQTLKMVVNYTGAVVLVDSHPIEHVWHMEWNLNEVILVGFLFGEISDKIGLIYPKIKDKQRKVKR